MAGRFIDELLRNGTTTAMTFATVHPDSVEAIFSRAKQASMCLIAGKVMMDACATPLLAPLGAGERGRRAAVPADDAG